MPNGLVADFAVDFAPGLAPDLTIDSAPGFVADFAPVFASGFFAGEPGRFAREIFPLVLPFAPEFEAVFGSRLAMLKL